MKDHRIKLTILVAFVVAGIGSGAVVAMAAGGGNSTDVSHSDVFFFAQPEERVGHSTVARKDDGVRMTFKSSGLAGDEAITIWWVVFNKPGNCSPPGCSEDDIFIDGDPANDLNEEGIQAADIVASYAAGDLSSRGGQATFRARLSAGEAGRDVLFGEGAVLKDPRGAEIHLVARSHGPAIPGLVDEQTGSYAGGCEEFLVPPEIPDGEGECADIQFSVHQP